MTRTVTRKVITNAATMDAVDYAEGKQVEALMISATNDYDGQRIFKKTLIW